jgi:hypothetical protein
MGVITVLLRAKYTPDQHPLLVEHACTSITRLSYVSFTMQTEVLDPPANQEVHLREND